MTTDAALVLIFDGSERIRALGTAGIYQDAAPTDADIDLGYVVFTMVSDPPQHVMAGPSEFTETNYQFAIFASRADRRAQIARAVKDEFDGYTSEERGALGTDPAEAVWFDSILFDGQRNAPESPEDGSQSVNFQRIQEYVVKTCPSPATTV